MVRTYSVKYKSKSKMPNTPEKIEELKKSILEQTVAKSVDVMEDGQIVSIEAEEDEFSDVMNTVVNLFRRIDDKSEVTYKFGLNVNNH